MGRFIIKHINTIKPQKNNDYDVVEENIVNEENNIDENEDVMTNSEKISMAQDVLNDSALKTKRIKKDKGLIERAESSKTILTEDNKELLND